MAKVGFDVFPGDSDSILLVPTNTIKYNQKNYNHFTDCSFFFLCWFAQLCGCEVGDIRTAHTTFKNVQFLKNTSKSRLLGFKEHFEEQVCVTCSLLRVRGQETIAQHNVLLRMFCFLWNTSRSWGIL